MNSKSCITCGMPFEGNHANDIGLELPEGMVCKFDSEDGKVKSGKEIFDGGVMFFAEQCTGGDKELAARLTRKNMNALPYWRATSLASDVGGAHHFPELDGAQATDTEFGMAMSKL